MRQEECAEAREQWTNAGGDEWNRRNAEEIDHEKSQHNHTGKYPGTRTDIKNRLVATTLFNVRRLVLEMDGVEQPPPYRR